MSEKDISDLFVKYRSQIFFQINKITFDKELAEDLLQDTFIKIIENYDKYDKELGQFNTWAITIAKNLTKDYLRKNKKWKMVRGTDESDISEWISDTTENAEDIKIKKEIDQENQSLLKKLSLSEMEMVKWRFEDGLKFREISATHNINISTAKIRFHRAVNNLQKIKKSIGVFYYNNNKTYQYRLEMSETTDNNISALRNHLFDAIRKLEAGTMKAEDAKAMASMAQTIINSAKLELDYKRMIEKQPNIKMLNE